MKTLLSLLLTACALAASPAHAGGGCAVGVCGGVQTFSAPAVTYGSTFSSGLVYGQQFAVQQFAAPVYQAPVFAAPVVRVRAQVVAPVVRVRTPVVVVGPLGFVRRIIR